MFEHNSSNKNIISISASQKKVNTSESGQFLVRQAKPSLKSTNSLSAYPAIKTEKMHNNAALAFKIVYDFLPFTQIREQYTVYIPDDG